MLVCVRSRQSKMQSVSMQDLEQLSYWQEKRRMSSHWYNIYKPSDFGRIDQIN